MVISRCLGIFRPILVLSIVMLFAGCGGSSGGSNGSAAAEDIDAMTVTMESAADYYQSLIDDGKSQSDTASETINWLKTQDGVTDAYLATDGRNIFVEDKTEIITLIITDTGSANDSSIVYSASSTLPMFPAYKSVSGSGESLKSILLNPYEFNRPNISTLFHILEDNSAVDIEVFSGNKVTPETFDNLSEFDIIYYFGHGGCNPKTGKTCIGTGEIFTQDRLDDYNKKIRDLNLDVLDENGKEKYIFRMVVKDVSLTNITKREISTFGITNHYIEQFAKDLKASIVYVDACVTMQMGASSTMAKAFVDTGKAKTYLGWDGYLNYHFDDTYNYLDDFFNDLFDGKDVGTACNNLNIDTFTGAELKLYGEKSTKIILSSTNGYTVSGRIALNGSGLSGVTVTLSGTGSSSTVTDSNGAYAFSNAENGSYTLTPSLAGYSFSPPSINVTVNNGNYSVQNVVATASSIIGYSVSGRITYNETGRAGVAVTLSGVGNFWTTTTDSNGAYIFTNIPNGSYAITPSLFVFSFNPSSVVVTVNGGDVAGVQDFTASLISYSITELPTLGGSGYSTPTSINDRGQVVGHSPALGGNVHAFFYYSSGQMVDLGTLGGAKSYATGINYSGQVVGYSDTSDGSVHAFLYSGGQMLDLGTLGGENSYAMDINDNGQIVGYSDTSDGSIHAFFYSGGQMTDLGTLTGEFNSHAVAINNCGQIAGYSENVDGKDRAILYSGGQIIDLGCSYGLSNYPNYKETSQACDIDDKGAVVGFSHYSSDYIGATSANIFSNGTISLLPWREFAGSTHGDVWRSQCNGINNYGHVVGGVTYVSYSFHDGFLYCYPILITLESFISPTSGWIISNATKINDIGQIIGNGKYNDVGHGYLMTPLNTTGGGEELPQ